MGLFNFGKKKDKEAEKETQQPGNPTTMMLFRALAIGYVLWMLKGLIEAYVKGGEDAPTLMMLVGAIVLLGGGCVFIGIMSYRQWKRMKAEVAAYNEEMARQVEEEERLEAERKALEEEYPEDGEYYEEEETEEEELPEEETE